MLISSSIFPKLQCGFRMKLRETRLIILSAAFLISAGTSVFSDTPQKTIMILNSYHSGYLWSDSIVQGIQSVIPPEMQISIEYMDTKRYSYERMEPHILEFLKEKCKARPPAGIISTDDNALTFLLAHHDEIFPDIPLVFCGVNQPPEELHLHRDHITGLFENNEHRETLLTALRLLPETKRIYFINDNTVSGVLQYNKIRAIAETDLSHIETVFLNEDRGINLDRINTALKDAPPHSIVYFADLNLDDKNIPIDYRIVLPELTRKYPLPFFASIESYINYGIVGGKVTSGFYQGELATHMLIESLSGTPASEIPIESTLPNKYIFNTEQLKRFGIPRKNLPENSILLNNEQSVFMQALVWILPAFLLALFFFFLATALLFNMYRRRTAEKALAYEQMLFRSMLDNIPDHIYFKDREGKYLKINAAMASYFGIANPEEAEGRTNEQFLPPEYAAYMKKIEDEILTKSHSVRVEEASFSIEGKPLRWESNIKIPIINEDGITIGTMGVSRDISQLKTTQEELEKSLYEKEVLLREVHHRVKNNLTMIVSLISLQEGDIESRKTLSFYTSLRNRIHSISLIHEKIYKSNDFTRINLKEYIEDLSGSITAAVGGQFSDLTIDIKVDNTSLVLEKAIPTGIILNELITNSLKHGFTRGGKNILSISAKRNKTELTLTITDNGNGYPESLDPGKTQSLGFRLIHALTAQLEGNFSWRNKNGAQSSITFPLE